MIYYIISYHIILYYTEEALNRPEKIKRPEKMKHAELSA